MAGWPVRLNGSVQQAICEARIPTASAFSEVGTRAHRGAAAVPRSSASGGDRSRSHATLRSGA